MPKYERDSFELASLASSDESRRSSTSSPSGISSSRKQSLEKERPQHGRSFSVSSAFDYASTLFPLTSTDGYAPVGAPAEGQASLEKRKSLTYLNGLSLIIGLVIGSGIFSSPSQVNSNVGSPGASLLVWVVSGVLVWTGASSYIELGSAIPLNGGAQVYLSKIFSELSGFLYSWSAICVLKPGSAAIIAIIFGEYLVRVFAGAEAEIHPWVNKGVSLIGLLVVTAINCASTRLATRIGDMFMFLKFIVLLAVTITGIVVAATGFSWDGMPNKEWKEHGWFEHTSTSVEQWAVALYAGLWAFDGWDNVSQLL
jgi:amino acid transporter